MTYYAIQEKATGRFISGTDYSRVDGKTRQLFATPSRPPLLLSEVNIQSELLRRRIDPSRFTPVIVEIRTVGSRENL